MTKGPHPCDKEGTLLKALLPDTHIFTDSWVWGRKQLHIVHVPNGHYWPHLLTDERLWSFDAARKMADWDDIEFRFGKSRVKGFIRTIIPGKQIDIEVEGDVPMQGEGIVEPEARGEYYAYNSNGPERWCVANPRGQKVASNFIHQQTAEHDASVRNNAASPVVTMAGR